MQHPNIDLSHLERAWGLPQGSLKLIHESEFTEEQRFQAALNKAKEEAILEENGGRIKGWHDCVRNIHIKFNGPATRALTDDEVANFQAQYAENPTADTMWRIMGEMSQMGAIDGEVVLTEMLQFYRNERLGLETGKSTSVLDVGAILSRLDNVLYQISQDKATPHYAKDSESERYEELQKMIRLIAGV